MAMLEEIPPADTLTELKDHFAGWWLDGGDVSRFEQYKAASMMASMAFGERKDLDSLMDMVDIHCQHMGLCSEWLPDAEGFLQAGLGLANEEVLGQTIHLPVKDRPNGTQTKALMESRVVNIQRCCRAIERLSATLNHRVDALRTIISTEKERWKAELNRPNQGGGKP